MVELQTYREHIDNIRQNLTKLPCKTPHNQDVILTIDERRKVAIVKMKSGAKNALSGAMIVKLTEIIDQLYLWQEGLGVLLLGDGGTFCSGSDLVGVRASVIKEGRNSTELTARIATSVGLQLAQVMQYNLIRLQRLPMVSVALIEGYALGGGAELATGADLRLMSDSARIGFVHVKNGICISWGGGTRLSQLVGPSRALDLLASGRLVGVSEAIQMGLANGRAQTETEAMDFLTSHLVGQKQVVGALKSMINSARTMTFNESLHIEALLFASSWGKEAHLLALDRNMKHNINGNINSRPNNDEANDKTMIRSNSNSNNNNNNNNNNDDDNNNNNNNSNNK